MHQLGPGCCSWCVKCINSPRSRELLKTGDAVRLAPVYDCAPMVMDLEGITRTTTWEQHVPRRLKDWGLL